MFDRRRLWGIALAFAVGSLTACGGDDDDAPTGGLQPESTSEEDGASDGGGATDGASSLEFDALDIDFEPGEASAAAGELEVTLINEGQIEHTWLVEDHEDQLTLEVVERGDEDSGTISLEAGTYTYYCDVTGHRAAGMEGTLTVE